MAIERTTPLPETWQSGERGGSKYPDLVLVLPSADLVGNQRAWSPGEAVHSGQPPGHRAGGERWGMALE